jgi:hypothetical protein
LNSFMDKLVGMNHLIISLLTLEMAIICVLGLWFENTTPHYLSTLQDLCNGLKQFNLDKVGPTKLASKQFNTLGLPIPQFKIYMEMLKVIPLHFLTLVKICFESYKNLGFLSLNFTCHALATNLGCNLKVKVITIIITPTIKSFLKHIFKIVDPL